MWKKSSWVFKARCYILTSAIFHKPKVFKCKHLSHYCPPPIVFCTYFIYYALEKHVNFFVLPILYTGKWWRIRMLHRMWRRTCRKWPHQWSGLFVKSLSFVFVLLYFLILINLSEAKIRLGCFSVGVRSYGFFFKSFKFLNILFIPDLS